jgi:hypothetical protein
VEGGLLGGGILDHIDRKVFAFRDPKGFRMLVRPLIDMIVSKPASYNHHVLGGVMIEMQSGDNSPLNFSEAFGLSLFLSGCHFKADFR